MYNTARGLITFPAVVASLGGAEWVQFNTRTARVQLPGQPLRAISRRLLPRDPGTWTAFQLADLVAKHGRQA
jgi:hypothetical protein